MRIIGNDPEIPRQTQVIASGAITGGKPVAVNTDGTVTQVNSVVEAIGSKVIIESGITNDISVAFDTNAERIIVSYTDQNSSNPTYQITYAVGTISGTSVSFGTAVNSGVRGAAHTMIFDSNANRIVFTYTLPSTEYGASMVGTVNTANNTISFGTPVVWHSVAAVADPNMGYDSTNNKFVVGVLVNTTGAYLRQLLVGTVDPSDNSCSFGTAVTNISGGSASGFRQAFDSNSNRMVMMYSDGNNGDYGTALVATVSGTDISVGSEHVYASHSVSLAKALDLCFDSNSNKIVNVFPDNTGSTKLGKVRVGTVNPSDNSISFGTAVNFSTGGTGIHRSRIAFDSNTNKVVIVYDFNESEMRYVVGTVSGTNISVADPVTFSTDGGIAGGLGIGFDSVTNAMLIGFKNTTGSANGGAAQVLKNAVPTNLTTENFIGIAEDTVATGQPVIINTKGAVDENQSSLTAGQLYFVQTDGTLDKAADTTSVMAGTAVSATKLIVKG